MEHIEKLMDQLNDNVLGVAESISEINIMITDAAAVVNDVVEENTDIVTLTGKPHDMACYACQCFKRSHWQVKL